MVDNSNRKVLIAMDGSEYSEEALKWFASKVYKNEDDVIVLHVTDHKESLSYSSPWLPMDPMIFQMKVKEEEDKAKETIKKVDALIKDVGIKAHVIRAHGNPGEQITKKAEELGVSMVIIGSRGLGTIRRTIMGSVSDFVLHHSHIPVVIFRH
ncbi:universal stress protein YxiE-like [Saccostrea cucullata]|uniref:universal stress protein YxiE-like n=1 Tax=Saccostrea cuccullata TaxID=36930 RepID=UPI002ED2584F